MHAMLDGVKLLDNKLCSRRRNEAVDIVTQGAAKHPFQTDRRNGATMTLCYTANTPSQACPSLYEMGSMQLMSLYSRRRNEAVAIGGVGGGRVCLFHPTTSHSDVHRPPACGNDSGQRE